MCPIDAGFGYTTNKCNKITRQSKRLRFGHCSSQRANLIHAPPWARFTSTRLSEVEMTGMRHPDSLPWQPSPANRSARPLPQTNVYRRAGADGAQVRARGGTKLAYGLQQDRARVAKPPSMAASAYASRVCAAFLSLLVARPNVPPCGSLRCQGCLPA